MNRIKNITPLAPERRAEMLAEKVRNVASQHDRIQGMLKKIHSQRRREWGAQATPMNRATTSWETPCPAITATK